MEHEPMEHRVAPAGHGAAWFRLALRMLGRSPRGLVQVASAYVLIELAPQLLASAPGASMVLSVALLVLGPALAAGLLHAVGEADAGRPVAVGHLFEGLRRPGVRAQLIVLGLFTLTEVVLMMLCAQRILGPENLKLFDQLMQHKIAPESPAAQALAVPMLKAMLVFFAIGLLLWTGLFFAVPRVMFDGRGGLLSIFESFATCASNVLPMLVYALHMAVAGFALFIALAIAGGALGVLGAFGNALFLLVLVAALVVCMVVSAAGNYLAWRDIYGNAGRAAPPSAGIIV